jgi:hypothetical protein
MTTPNGMALLDAVQSALATNYTLTGVYASGDVPASAVLPYADLFPMPATTNRTSVGAAQGREGVQVTVRAGTLRQVSDLADAVVILVAGLSAATVTGAKIFPGGLSLSGSGGGRMPASPAYDILAHRYYSIVLRFVQDDLRPIE